MKIGVGVITYNVAKELQWLIDSLAGKDGKTTNGNEVVLLLHQHSTAESQPEVTQICRHADEELNWAHYYYHGQNRGLSASWNDMLIQGYDDHHCDVVLLVNDDIQFLPGGLDAFAEYAVSRRDAYMVTTLGYHHFYASNSDQLQQPIQGFGFSCFAVNPIAIETIGYFDENIAPIYDEDCDYGERGYRAGLQQAECKTVTAIHWGSLSKNTPEQQRVLAERGRPRREYFCRKWGLDFDFTTGSFRRYFGDEARRLCKTPFNDPPFGVRIGKEERHYPYGPLHDRYDVPGRVPVWEEHALLAETWPSTDLVPNMPEDYVQPSTARYRFRSGSGGNSIWFLMEQLADFAVRSNGVIVEVGSGCGDGSTHAFDCGIREKCLFEDIFNTHISVCNHPVASDWEPRWSNWQMVVGDSRSMDTVNTVSYLLGATPGNIRAECPDMIRPGIIYIDTEHTYECLKRELEIWTDIGNKDTLYLFHDVLAFPEMTQAILETVQPGGHFYESHDYRVVSQLNTGLGALVPKAGWGK